MAKIILYNLLEISSCLPLISRCQKATILDLMLIEIDTRPNSPYKIMFGVDFLALSIIL